MGGVAHQDVLSFIDDEAACLVFNASHGVGCYGVVVVGTAAVAAVVLGGGGLAGVVVEALSVGTIEGAAAGSRMRVGVDVAVFPPLASPGPVVGGVELAGGVLPPAPTALEVPSPCAGVCGAVEAVVLAATIGLLVAAGVVELAVGGVKVAELTDSEIAGAGFDGGDDVTDSVADGTAAVLNRKASWSPVTHTSVPSDLEAQNWCA